MSHVQQHHSALPCSLNNQQRIRSGRGHLHSIWACLPNKEQGPPFAQVAFRQQGSPGETGPIAISSSHCVQLNSRDKAPQQKTTALSWELPVDVCNSPAVYHHTPIKQMHHLIPLAREVSSQPSLSFLKIHFIEVQFTAS